MNKEFLWGSATAAYQCEGGWKEGGKGLSNWDVFCHSEKNSVNPVTGDVACDFYHHYEEDIRMLAEGGRMLTVFLSHGPGSCRMVLVVRARKALTFITVSSTPAENIM